MSEPGPEGVERQPDGAAADRAAQIALATTVTANVSDVRARIAAAAARSGRDPGAVRLVAVTKSVGLAAIPVLAAAGVTDIAENRAPQLAMRRAALAGVAGLRWHLIGHWQTNKVRRTVLAPDIFHALDSLHLARLLSAERVRADAAGVLPVLLQVNVSGEGSKGGFSPERSALGAALDEIGRLPGLSVQGLMTMAPENPDREAARPVFVRLRELRDWAGSSGYLRGSELSMGMSDDFETGIEEGSTMVRIGRRLFAPLSNGLGVPTGA
jgi:pyridoxal phosphate enzyme (YggS family)